MYFCCQLVLSKNPFYKMLQVLHGKEKSHLNVIFDPTHSNSINFAFVRQILKNNTAVDLFCLHVSPREYESNLTEYQKSRLHLHDYYTDPFDWYTNTLRASVKDTVSDNSVLIIDDALLFGRSFKLLENNGEWSSFINYIVDLTKDHRVFLFVNPATSKECEIRLLKHVCSFYATITMNNQSYQCKSIYKKKSGKVISETNVLSLNEEELLISKMNTVNSSLTTNDTVKKTDPTSNLTFNLHLTESEKEARSNTTLPYLLSDSNKALYLNKKSITGGGGLVIYTPDDADDFDEEDPDDDLDI